MTQVIFEMRYILSCIFISSSSFFVSPFHPFFFYEFLGFAGLEYPNEKKLIPKRGIFFSIWILNHPNLAFQIKENNPLRYILLSLDSKLDVISHFQNHFHNFQTHLHYITFHRKKKKI